MNAFLCHDSADTELVGCIRSLLAKVGVSCFYYPALSNSIEGFNKVMLAEAARCDSMVVFINEDFRSNQISEVSEARSTERQSGVRKHWIFVILHEGADLTYLKTIDRDPDFLARIDHAANGNSPEGTAKKIAFFLGIPWTVNGLPENPRLFSYEKDIIEHLARVLALGVASNEVIDTSKLDPKDRGHLELCRQGAPFTWPAVENFADKLPSGELHTHLNLLVHQDGREGIDIGEKRDRNRHVNTSCTLVADGPRVPSFSLPEAGPRENLLYPRENRLKVGIVVSGGIAPGINAVIDGIVQRHWLYAKEHKYEKSLEILGFQNGFLAFERNAAAPRLLAANQSHANASYRANAPGRQLITSHHAHEGGSMLGTSRVEALHGPDANKALNKIAEALKNRHEIDILYIIGGDGSMKAAHALWTLANPPSEDGSPPAQSLSIVGIPKTMDNDILWVWQSFGFLSAVDKAREVIENLFTEVSSNPRLGVVQLFGSDSGFVVSHAVLASSTNHCTLALIPEMEFSIERVARHMIKRMAANANEKSHNLPFGLIVMAESAIPTDAHLYLGLPPKPPAPAPDPHDIVRVGFSSDEEAAVRKFLADGRRIQGQTSDSLRSAGLKLMSVGLLKQLQKFGHPDYAWNQLRCLTNEPRHILRAVPPSCSDIINGQRLGTLAVDNAMAGYTDFMISQWLTEYVLVPLSLVVLGRKRIPKSGIFWKSVLAKTGQHTTDLELPSAP